MSLKLVSALVKSASPGGNAMFWKDTTQWLRKGVFMGLFFGLLLLCWGVTALVLLVCGDDGSAGPVAFGNLTNILTVYLLSVAFMGYLQTLGDFADGTFELYALTGISMEKIVFGKLFSMFAQFFFGACCAIPFMFFAYLLRGLDFSHIFGVILLYCYVAPPLFLLLLMLAFGGSSSRHFSLLVQIGALLLILFAAVRMAFSLYTSLDGQPFALVTNCGRLCLSLATLDPGAVVMCGVLLAFQLLACFIIYGFCLSGLASSVEAFALLTSPSGAAPEAPPPAGEEPAFPDRALTPRPLPWQRNIIN